MRNPFRSASLHAQPTDRGAEGIPPAELCWLSEGDATEWDAFVGQHPQGLPYHLWGWKGFLEEVFPHIKGGILVLRDPASGAILGGIPLYRASSIFLGKRMISSPFATLGGPLALSTASRDILLAGALREAERSGSRNLRIRGVRDSDPMLVAGAFPGFAATATNLHHFVQLPQTPDLLRKRLSKGAHRAISKARKEGVKAIQAVGKQGTEPLVLMHARTRRRLGLPVYPKGFFEALQRHLPDSIVSVQIAMRGEELIGGIVTLNLGDWVIYEHLADTPSARTLGTAYLMLWESMSNAIEQGRRIYSLGRTACDNAGLIQFKRAWGATEERLSTYIYPAVPQAPENPSAPGLAHRLTRWGFRSLPDPLARRAGAFFYRHWA